MSEPKKIVITSIKQWHTWLEKNHDKERIVSLVLNKRHTGIPAPSHQELMYEAICFGWIDTTVNRLDENQYLRNFAKRREKSKWSDNTFKYAKQLIKEKRMAPAGLAAYKDGLTRPTHHHGIPNNPNVPKDLKLALSKKKEVYDYFKTMAPSTRKTYLRWMLGAKLPETRKKRIIAIFNACKAKTNIFKSKAE